MSKAADTTIDNEKDPVEAGAVVATFPRSVAAEKLAAAISPKRFVLQRCKACDAAIHPPRDACPSCWNNNIEIAEMPEGGTLVSVTRLHHSNSPYFRQRLPWRIGMVKLDCGPMALAHVHAGADLASRVRMQWRMDSGGNAVLLALPDSAATAEADPRLDAL